MTTNEIEKIYQIQGELLSESEAKLNNFNLQGYNLTDLKGLNKDLQWNPPYLEIVEIKEGQFKFNQESKEYTRLV